MNIWIEYLFVGAIIGLTGFVTYHAHKDIEQRQHDYAILVKDLARSPTMNYAPAIAGGTLVYITQ